MGKSKKAKEKKLDYIAITVLILLLLGSLIVGKFIMQSPKPDLEKDLNLDKYRSTDIPEECRLPEYETRVESWKQHLSHHQNTLYCLDYYE